MFDLQLKKVYDMVYSLNIKSQFENEAEYNAAMYFLLTVQRQYAKSVIERANVGIDTSKLTLFNFPQISMKAKDPATRWHVMLCAFCNTMIDPLAKEIQKQTGELPPDPFPKKDQFGTPDFKPRQL